MESEEHLIAARTAGVVRCRSVKRRPVQDQFDQQMLLAMQGTPWDSKGKLATPVPMMGGAIATPAATSVVPAAASVPVSTEKKVD
eukprot:2875573-Amphidinium_carterae.1